MRYCLVIEVREQVKWSEEQQLLKLANRTKVWTGRMLLVLVNPENKFPVVEK